MLTVRAFMDRPIIKLPYSEPLVWFDNPANSAGYSQCWLG